MQVVVEGKAVEPEKPGQPVTAKNQPLATQPKKSEQTKETKPLVPKEVIDKQKSFDKKIDRGDLEEKEEPKEPKPAGDAQTAPEKEDSKKDGKPPEKTEEQSGKEPAEEKPKLSPEILLRAANAGLTLAQAISFSSNEDLENALAIFEAKTPKPDDKTGKDGKEGEEKPEIYDCGLDPGEYDENIIKKFNEMGQTIIDLKKQLKVSQEKVSEDSDKATRNATIIAHTAWIDSQFSKLGPETEDLFGKGNHKDLKPDTEHYKNRAAVDREVMAIAAGYKSTGQSPPPKDKIFERAVNNLFSEKIKAVKETATKDRLNKRAKQAIGPGSAADVEENKVLKLQQEFDAKIDAKD
jgi:hypothetical protein